MTPGIGRVGFVNSSHSSTLALFTWVSSCLGPGRRHTQRERQSHPAKLGSPATEGRLDVQQDRNPVSGVRRSKAVLPDEANSEATMLKSILWNFP